MKFLLENQETKRLYFRKILPSDFDAWLEFFKNPATSIHWISKRESPRKECEKWYHNQFDRYKNDRGGMNALIEKESDRLIGHSGLLKQIIDNNTELEVAYSLLPEFWNRGFATEAAIKCKTVAFENNFSDSLISIISLSNIPSGKVALKNGMHLEKRIVHNNNEVNIFRVNKSGS